MSKMNIDSYKVSFSQDYNLLNHINWIINNKPQDKTEHINDSSLLDLSNANIKRLLKKGVHKSE